MNWYKTAKSQSQTIQKIHEFLDSMNNIKWGWIDENNEKHTNTDEWLDTYHVMSPNEVRKYEIGTCIDQTILEQEWFKKNLPNIQTKILWMQQFKDDDHMWLAFKYNDKWYRFEHSWADQRGIHGPYNTAKDTEKKVNKGSNFNTKIMNDFKYQSMSGTMGGTMGGQEFLEAMDYDFDKEA